MDDEKLIQNRHVILKKSWSAVVSLITFLFGLLWIVHNQYQRIHNYNEKLENQMEESQRKADEQSEKIQNAIQKKIEEDLKNRGILIENS